MSRSILRKDKIESTKMDGESRNEEPFLKIETIWSETKENFDNITVKEEVISDVEPGNLLEEHLEDSYECSLSDNPEESGNFKNDDSIKDIVEKSAEMIWKERDKKRKGKVKGDNDILNVSCLHESKNFKVVNKRLRCCDCKSILCPECHCTIGSSLQTHFSKSDNNNKSLYPCKLCSMIFRSNCALQAHIRIHLLDTPYVCPDCGAVYNNIYFLSLHLINKCYHVYKVIINGCKFCLSQNMAPEDYMSHIEQAHIRPVYKCSYCGLMFENTRDINRHLGTAHKNENVTSLNYFCCSMCGNLIISKHLYSKHVQYHQDHSAAFQVGYLCPCGQSFNSASSFRVHFKSCYKKGILPPQWTYLQVTLKTQEMLQVQNAIQKTLLQTESSLMCNTAKCTDESGIEQGKLDYNLFVDGVSSEDPEEQQNDESSRRESEENEDPKTRDSLKNHEEGTELVQSDTVTTTVSSTVLTTYLNNTDVNENNRKSCDNLDEGDNGRQMKPLPEDQSASGESEKNICSWSFQFSQQGLANTESSLEDGEMITERSGLIPNVQLMEEFSQESVDENNFHEHCERSEETNKKVEWRVGDKSLKILYDHIPCDHLGYLKTQQYSELKDKNKGKDKIDTITNCELGDDTIISDSENYLITSVLDEKTGLMKTRKLHVRKNENEPADENFACLGVEPGNPGIFSNIHCREIFKPRSSTFFSCPFCSVLFPKHFSSFQRFRLHLECYHPEAALDITVSRTQIPKSQTQFTSIRINDDFDSDDDLWDLDNIDLQTRLDDSLRESLREEKNIGKNNESSEFRKVEEKHTGSKNVDNRKKNVSSAEHYDNIRVERPEFDMKLRSSKICEKEQETFHNMSEKSDTKLILNCRKNSFNRKVGENCRSLFKSSLNGNVINNRRHNSSEENIMSYEKKNNGRSVFQKEQDLRGMTLKSKDMSDVITRNDEQNDENFQALDDENFTIHNRPAKARQSEDDESDLILTLEEKNVVKDKRGATLLKKPFSVVNQGSHRINEDTLTEGNSHDVNECYDGKVENNLSSKICRVRTVSHKNHYFKNTSSASKLQNEDYVMTDFQEADFEKTDNSNQSQKDEILGVRRRSVDRRNSRRESDVWSEFYKTLKIAEALKKTKVKNREKNDDGNKEVSILTNYTNKRVVKKPKRYRESSDSDDSNEDGKHSAGESKSFESRMAIPGNDMEDDELYIKKKKLLSRLENLDHRIMDYIFDLIDSKEKSYGLYKKNPDLNVRNCKKRVVNGMKATGRQQKNNLSPDNDDEMSLDFSSNAGEKDVTDVNYDETEWDARNSPEEKNVDKRRGRPKKNESLTVKERRRSDFDREVNFIEKNFEADESDFFTNKRKRKLSSKLQYYKKISAPTEKNDFSSGQVISTKNVETEKKLTCAVCKESCLNETEFREHIQMHRVDDNGHQCMECGECFVVRPSLEKHLHAYHKIKDVQKYIEENECSITEKNEEVDCEPLKENQCKVCRDQFANAHDLNKHFRIHGMAFLRQFRKETKST